MRSILMCLVFLCALSAAAQDVMNLTDVTAIHYENGEKRTFSTVMEQSSSSNEQFVFSRESGYIGDGALLAMAEEAKIKRLKKAGWSTGGMMLGVGVPLLAWGIAEGFMGVIAPGIALTCAGSIITTGCVVRANNLKKQTINRVASTPVWQNDFKLNNNATLSTQICTIQDTHKQSSTLGFGLSYQF